MKKQLWTGLSAFVGILILILDSKTALNGAQQGLELCLKTVIPSLFPFFLLSILLTSSLVGMDLPLLRPFARLFHIPEGTESLLISAFLGGYPVGAQNIAEAYRSGHLEKQDAERMLAFCNNAGPSFLFGIVASMFPNVWMAWALWGIHIFSAYLVSRFFQTSGNITTLHGKKDASITSVMSSAIKVMAAVCSWVVLFRVMIAFFSRWILWILPTDVQVAIIGLLELSNGCCELMAVEDVSLRFIICSGILAFGGVCVTMQTISVTKGLSLRPYFLGKLLQTIFSLLLSAAIIFQVWFLVMVFAVFFLLIPRKMQNSSRNPRTVGV